MGTESRADLRLRLEDFVDRFVADGAEHKDVIEAAQEIEHLRKAYEHDPTDNETVIDELANDWPSAT